MLLMNDGPLTVSSLRPGELVPGILLAPVALFLLTDCRAAWSAWWYRPRPLRPR